MSRGLGDVYKRQVEDAVDMALDILNGNAPEDPVKIIPTTILDRDTVESHLDENSPY